MVIPVLGLQPAAPDLHGDPDPLDLVVVEVPDQVPQRHRVGHGRVDLARGVSNAISYALCTSTRWSGGQALDSSSRVFQSITRWGKSTNDAGPVAYGRGAEQDDGDGPGPVPPQPGRQLLPGGRPALATAPGALGDGHDPGGDGHGPWRRRGGRRGRGPAGGRARTTPYQRAAMNAQYNVTAPTTVHVRAQHSGTRRPSPLPRRTERQEPPLQSLYVHHS